MPTTRTSVLQGREHVRQTRFRCPLELLLPDEAEVRECVG